MFLNALKNNEFLSYFFYLLLAVGFAINAFNVDIIDIKNVFIDLQAFLGDGIIYRVSFVLVWLLSLIWINRLMTKYKILDLKGGIPIFLFALFSFTFFQFEISLEVDLAILFLLFSLEQLFIIYQTQGRLYQSLNLGFLFGAATFFYFPLMLLLPWLIISISIYKTLKWRDVFLPIIGILIPFYLYTVFNFFLDKPLQYLSTSLVLFEIPKMLLSLVQNNFLFGGLLLVSLAIIVYSIRIKDSITIKNRMFYNVLLLFFVGVLVLLFFSVNSLPELSLLLIPLSFLGAPYFNTVKRLWFFDLLIVAYWVAFFIK